jgi:hypothetical protein
VAHRLQPRMHDIAKIKRSRGIGRNTVTG